MTTKPKEKAMTTASQLSNRIRALAPTARTKATKKAKARSKALVVHKPKPPQSTLEMIAQAARDPRVDVAKMRELLAMKREEEQRQAEIIFNNALADAKEEMPTVVKDAKGDRGIAYAKLESVSKMLDPILKRHNFTINYGMADSPDPTKYRITAEVRHRAGFKIDRWADIPESITGPKGAPIMTKAQGAGAAISFGRRYLKLMIFDIPIAGEDTNGIAPGEPLSSDEIIDLQNKMTKAKAETKKFCEYFKIDSVVDLARSDLPEANRILAKMIRQWEGATNAD